MAELEIRLLILDADGVLTDGRLAVSADGERVKYFFVQDGCAIKLWQRAGRQVAIVSGRGSDALAQRARELGVSTVLMDTKDKADGYRHVLDTLGFSNEQTAYMGDDLADLGPMTRCGFAIAPANAVAAVKRVAACITRRSGGAGAVAEAIELLLRKQHLWTSKLLDKA